MLNMLYQWLMIFFDTLFMMSVSVALFIVCFSKKIKSLKNLKYGASHVFVGMILFIEIFFMDYYSVMNGATPYKMYAFMQLLSLTALFAMPGGGVWKLVIMSLYIPSQLAHYICFTSFNGIKFPYLYIINIVGYLQIFVLLYSPKSESKVWYERLSSSLTRMPLLGSYFNFYISNHFNGLPKVPKGKA